MTRSDEYGRCYRGRWWWQAEGDSLGKRVTGEAAVLKAPF